MNQQRWITAVTLGSLLVAMIIGLLAFAAAWTPESLPRCFADIAHSEFPKWLGCAVATHETLAGSLIAAGGALFGAWLAFVGVQDQIGLAQKNEREAKRLAHDRKIQNAGRDLELVRTAWGFVDALAHEFPQMDIAKEPQGRFVNRLLDLRARGGLQMSEKAARAPDSIGDSIKTVIGRLNTLADNLHEEVKNLTADVRQQTLRGRETAVVEQVADLHRLAGILQQKAASYDQKYKTAVAEQID